MKNRKQGFLGAEKRKFPRASARVIYAAVKTAQYLGTEVYTKDISIGGIGFTAKEAIAQNEILSFDIVFPGGGSFTVRGMVMRVEPITVKWTPKLEYEIGVKFMNLAEIAKEYIQDYLAKFISSETNE